MDEYKIVIGREKGKRKKKYMMRVVNKKTTYHEFKQKTHKYTNKNNSSNPNRWTYESCNSYNVYKPNIDIEIIETTPHIVETSRLAFGF